MLAFGSRRGCKACRNGGSDALQCRECSSKLLDEKARVGSWVRYSERRKEGMTLNLFACLVLLCAIPASAQNTPKSIALTDKSTVPPEEILKPLHKGCPNVSITNDLTKSDYMLEAIKSKVRQGLGMEALDTFDLTLFDSDGKALRSASNPSLANAVKDLCQAIKASVMVEVVDTQNLTQSRDARGDTSGGAVGTVVNGVTGRRTHTDTSTIYVIVNGEHALLDCYERRTGCPTIGPGKYYGEQDGDGIWVNFQMPLTHKWVRNHYKVAGSW